MSETLDDIASVIVGAAEPAAARNFRTVQRRCLAALTTSDTNGLLLFSAAMIAGEAADRIEGGHPMTSESSLGWRTLAHALADALASGASSDLEACIRLLHPPKQAH